jgi:hypothetical protein
MYKTKKNYNLGLSVLIAGYATLLCWIMGIFLGVKLGIGWPGYTAVGFFILFLIASGILFLISLIYNIQDSRKDRHLSSGLIFTIISFPPIMFCYTAVLVKALTEGH